MPASAASPVASTTPIVSSSTAPAGPVIPNVHASADSPTSIDKTKSGNYLNIS